MRLIDADMLTYSRTKDGDIVVYPEAIAEAQTIEQPKWIPCSERLPSLGEEVLVWAYDRCYLLTLYAYPNNEGYYWNVENYNIVDDEFDKVVAWMPLPLAYRESDN